MEAQNTALHPQDLWEDNTTTDLPPGVLMRVRGRAGTADLVNANHRLYPAAVYQGVVRQFSARDHREELLGELDHPEHPAGPSLGKTAMRIIELCFGEERHLDFAAHVLDTSPGRTLASLVKAGIPVNISTRGRGTLISCCKAHEGCLPQGAGSTPGSPDHHQPYQVVAGDYQLHGIDAVVRGAHPSAFIGGNRAASGSTHEREEPMQDLRETPGPASEGRIAALEAELQSTRADLQVLQAAAAAERETLAAALSSAETDLAAAKVSLEAECTAHAEQIAEAEEARDLAIDQLNKSRVEEQTHNLLASLRPDVRKKVADQLASCRTPEEVKDRWNAIESVLSGAGLLIPAPAGAGRPDHGDTPRSQSASLTPEQLLQRHLLGLA